MRSSSRARSSRRAASWRICASSRAAAAFSERAAFFETGQVGAQRGMLFAHRVRVRLQTLELAARFFQRLFLIEAGLLFFGDQRLALLALRPRALIFARQPLELQPRHREPRTRARVFFGQLALLMIERQRVFFLRLLRVRARAPDPRPAPPCRVPALPARQSAASASRCRASTWPLSSRSSRFSASGPPAVLRPPLTAWP